MPNTPREPCEGSANINMRSLAGTRDSEIAAGLWQPAHYAHGPNNLPKGQVHGFRMSVWAEHMCGKGGSLDTSFWTPSSLECVHHVNARAEVLPSAIFESIPN